MLERTLNERYPGSAADHLDNIQGQSLDSSAPAVQGFHFQPQAPDFQFGTSPVSEDLWQWNPPQTASQLPAMMGLPNQTDTRGVRNSPPDYTTQGMSGGTVMASSLPSQGIIPRPDGVDDIPTATAASFFRIYFQFIHPQYPFLSVKECGDWYTEWKLAPAHSPITGWPAYFVKMVGSFPLSQQVTD